MGPAQRRMACRGVPVFTYHKIARPPAGTRDPFLYVDPASFDAQLTVLRSYGFTSGTLADLRAIRAASQPKAIITFDDGFRNVLDNGLEILARHQFRAIQFLVSGFLGRTNEWDIEKGDVAEPLMDEVQVRTWLAAGHEIGSHSATRSEERRGNLRQQEVVGRPVRDRGAAFLLSLWRLERVPARYCRRSWLSHRLHGGFRGE